MSKSDLVYTTYIKTTPEKLWQAITNPEFARQYWGGNANISDWKKGSAWEHQGMADNKPVNYVGGKIMESIPHKRLVLSWIDPNDLADVSHVSFEIRLVHDLVCLVVTHTELSADMAGKVSNGWPLVLSSMKSFLETGKAIDIVAVKGPCGGAEAAA